MKGANETYFSGEAIPTDDEKCSMIEKKIR
jgi:hypothetical protein